MSSQLILRMLLLAAASASGAPLEDARADDPAGVEASGEEEETVLLLGSWNVFDTWEEVIDMTKCHEEEFEKEFQGNEDYTNLDNYTLPSFPVVYPKSNISKEAFLQSLAQGLLNYMVLLKHVKKEYPNCSMVPNVSNRVPQLVNLFKTKMRKSGRVKALTSSQEQKLLQELDHPYAFIRKMRAHSILSSLRLFLVDGMRSFCKWEKPKNQAARTSNTNCSCEP